MKFRTPGFLFIAVVLATINLSTSYAVDHKAPVTAAAKDKSPAELIVGADAPLAAPLASGLVVVPFSTKNLRIAPIYGAAGLDVIPRVGHLHISVDNASWHWVHSTDDSIVIQGLSQGPHQLTLTLADANHRRLAVKVLNFTIP